MPITPSPAVSRAAEVLVHLARHPTSSFTVSELARAMGAPRATCDAVLLALAAEDFVVRRNDDLRYELGPACIMLGDAARVANTALSAAVAEAERLARQTSTCVALATRGSADTRVSDVFDFGPPFGIRTRVGQSIPLVAPFGAVFIVWDDDATVERWLNDPSPPLTEAELAHYRRALAGIRRQGYSITTVVDRRPDLVAALDTLRVSPETQEAQRLRDEAMLEFSHSEYLQVDVAPGASLRVSQLSAPVFDRSATVAAVMIVLGPTYELSAAEIETIGEQLKESAATATRQAGGRAPS